jgi:hypothetical protein
MLWKAAAVVVALGTPIIYRPRCVKIAITATVRHMNTGLQQVWDTGNTEPSTDTVYRVGGTVNTQAVFATDGVTATAVWVAGDGSMLLRWLERWPASRTWDSSIVHNKFCIVVVDE